MSFPRILDRIAPGLYHGRIRAEAGQEQRCYDKHQHALKQFKHVLTYSKSAHLVTCPAKLKRRLKYWDAQRWKWDGRRFEAQRRGARLRRPIP